MRGRDHSHARSVYLELNDGRCEAARAATPEDQRQAHFVLVAKERIWRRLVEGRSDPLVVLMTGRIHFERGRRIDFAGHGKAARELMRAAQRIAV